MNTVPMSPVGRDFSWPLSYLYRWLWERRKAQWIKEAVIVYHREGFTHFTKVDGLSLWEAFCERVPLREWPTPVSAVKNAEDESFKTIW